MYSHIRAKTRQFTDSLWFQNFVIIIILANSITLGLETYPALMQSYGQILLWLDTAFLTFFVVELALKFFGQGWREFCRRPWNWFDAIIVFVSLMPFLGNLSALRALRILRLLSVVPAFQSITEALIRAARGAGAVFGLLLLVLSVFALLSSKLFGAALPNIFGTFHVSFATHFQLMVFDNWRGVVDQMVFGVGTWTQWYAMFYSAIAGFILASLLIGVIIESLQMRKPETETETETEREPDIPANHKDSVQ